ncbi:MAG: nuclear transport factor 2 family protein [Acidimicrobiia bacterium]
MPSQQIEGTVDLATVERLSTAFNRCFETLDAGQDLFAPDAFFDIYPPLWRFQLQGPDAFAAHLREIADGPAGSRILRVVPTATGFAMEHEEEGVHGTEPLVARHLWLCEVRDSRITEAVGYCNGGWDAELRARHAAEAPMLRP